MKGGTRIRISGGELRGQFIRSPHQFHSRPTQDRVREAIFSSIAGHLPGARVLDLYAGSGALGIEALSRGAASAMFVDNHPKCITVIQSNLKQCRLDGTVRRADAVAFCRQPPAEKYDLILLDPPYDTEASRLDDAPLLPLLPAMTTPGGLVVWEHAARATWIHGDQFGVTKTRRYGDSAISYLIPGQTECT
jgi:16S rRNA (guanine966-N2)-methyltransferase